MNVTVFKCLMCNDCCFFSNEGESPIVLPDEKRLLLREAIRFNIKPESLTFKPYEVYNVRDTNVEAYIVLSYRWIIRGYCPFYNMEERKCLIHKVKPLSCSMFPLILNVTFNLVHVSDRCRWVRENLDLILRSNPKDVFPYEIKCLIEAFTRIHRFTTLLKSKFKTIRRIDVDNLPSNVKLVDIDQVLP